MNYGGKYFYKKYDLPCITTLKITNGWQCPWFVFYASVSFQILKWAV